MQPPNDGRREPSRAGTTAISRVRRVARILLALLVGAAGLAAPTSTGRSPHARTPVPKLVRMGSVTVQPKAPTATLNVLVAGVTPIYDRRGRILPETFRGNTDALVLMQVDPGGRRVRTLSLPRDTRVMLPGRGWRKLNAALPMLGPEALKRVVSDLTGVPVHGYVLINFAGVRDLTNAVGGVSLYLPRAMDYDDYAGKLHIHLRPGVRRLNGAQAEGFVRFRHDALGDIGRTQRHQAYVRAVARRLLSPAGPSYLPGVSRVMTRTVRTDLKPVHVAALLGTMARAPRVETMLLPGRFETVGGVSYWGMDLPAARKTLAAFGSRLPGAVGTVDRRSVRVAVVGIGVSAAEVARVRDRLRRAGYTTVFESRRGTPAGRSSAVLSNGGWWAAEGVRRTLGFPEARVSGEGAIDADVTVWVGRGHTAAIGRR